MITLLMILAQASASTDRDCWVASVYDTDNDGYSSGSMSNSVVVPSPDDTLECPAGYVSKKGDCDDSDAAIHPRRLERYGNNLDDDCNTLVDEPQFQYYPAGFNNTTFTFAMRVNVRDADTVDAWRNRSTLTTLPGSHGLGYEIIWQPLTDTSALHYAGKTRVTTFTDSAASHRTDIALTNLTPNTMYRARVQFYTWSVGILGTTTWTAIGDASTWYYTSTDGFDGLSQARTDTILAGTYEFYRSEHLGEVGYHGTVSEDGVAYGAGLGLNWCSEFYADTITTAFNLDVPVTYTEDLIDWFNAHGQEIDDQDAGWSLAAVETDARRGDYFGIDSNPTDAEDYNHSAMFLAYDTHLDAFWTLEGNSDLRRGGDLFTVLGTSRRNGNEVTIDNIDKTTVAAWGQLATNLQ